MRSRVTFILLFFSILFSFIVSSSGNPYSNIHNTDQHAILPIQDNPNSLSTPDTYYSTFAQINGNTRTYTQPRISSLYDPKTFVSTWDTQEVTQGSSNTTAIHLPLEENGSYNFIVDWGDNTTSDIISWNQTQTTHYFQNSGKYVVTINGTLNGWQFNQFGDRSKLLEISQWGDLQLGNSGSYFAGSDNLVITAADSPNLNGTTNMNYAFAYCYALGTSGNMNSWDMSHVTDMSRMFSDAQSFNQPLNSWNVSNVTDMSNMFFSDSSFNQPLNSWDISNVTDMSYMFFNTTFNQPLNSWDVSSVTDMSHMFTDTPFNQPLGQWDVSNVIQMAGIFRQTPFNQPLNSWDVSNVIDISDMFSFTPFNQPLDQWDVSNVTKMGKMFCFSPFNQPLNSWNVSKVTEMSLMFLNASSFNQPLDQWDVSNVKGMEKFLLDTSFSTENYDALLQAWAQLNLQQNVVFNVGSTKYSENATNARSTIINKYSWDITDGGLATTPTVTTKTSDKKTLNPGFELIGIVMVALVLLNRLKILSLRFKFE